jgi:hypothetical protein
MNLAVIGTRDLGDAKTRPEKAKMIAATIDDFLEKLVADGVIPANEKITLHTPGGQGIGNAVAEVGKLRDNEVKTWAADWDKQPDNSYNKNAGIERTTSMIREADAVVLIWQGKGQVAELDAALAVATKRNLPITTRELARGIEAHEMGREARDVPSAPVQFPGDNQVVHWIKGAGTFDVKAELKDLGIAWNPARTAYACVGDKRFDAAIEMLKKNDGLLVMPEARTFNGTQTFDLDVSKRAKLVTKNQLAALDEYLANGIAAEAAKQPSFYDKQTGQKVKAFEFDPAKPPKPYAEMTFAQVSTMLRACSWIKKDQGPIEAPQLKELKELALTSSAQAWDFDPAKPPKAYEDFTRGEARKLIAGAKALERQLNRGLDAVDLGSTLDPKHDLGTEVPLAIGETQTERDRATRTADAERAFDARARGAGTGAKQAVTASEKTDREIGNSRTDMIGAAIGYLKKTDEIDMAKIEQYSPEYPEKGKLLASNEHWFAYRPEREGQSLEGFVIERVNKIGEAVAAKLEPGKTYLLDEGKDLSVTVSEVQLEKATKSRKRSADAPAAAARTK